MLQMLIPKIFYADVSVGIDLFVDAIGLEILYQDETLTVVGKGTIKAYLIEDAEWAAKDRPELAIETDDIDAVYADIAGRRPDLLHPNLPSVTRREWGALEFAVVDASTVCVVFRDWTADGTKVER